MKEFNLDEIINNIDLGSMLNTGDIPEVDLYMDQVMQIFEQQLGQGKRKEEDKVLTKTMINNYIKSKLLMKIKDKKYSKDHLLLLGIIYELKGGLCINDIKKLTTPIVKSFEEDKETNLRELYSFIEQIHKSNKDICINNFKDIISTEEENLLKIYNLINLSNMYRRIAEEMIDKI